MNLLGKWLVLSLFLLGCDAGTESAKDSFPGKSQDAVEPIIPEDVISSWGYRTVSIDQPPQSDWELRTFGKALIRIQAIKAMKEIPDWKDAYYRFTIVEEAFENVDSARSRSQRLEEHDPKLDSKMLSKLILRDGFRAKNRVVYATTDVSKFEIEQLPEIVALLKAHVQKTTEGDPDDVEEPPGAVK